MERLIGRRLPRCWATGDGEGRPEVRSQKHSSPVISPRRLLIVVRRGVGLRAIEKVLRTKLRRDRAIDPRRAGHEKLLQVVGVAVSPSAGPDQTQVEIGLYKSEHAPKVVIRVADVSRRRVG